MFKQLTDTEQLVGQTIADITVVGESDERWIVKFLDDSFAVLESTYESNGWSNEEFYPYLNLLGPVDHNFLYHHGLAEGLIDQAEYDAIATKLTAERKLVQAKERANELSYVLATVLKYKDDPTFTDTVVNRINGISNQNPS